MPLTSADEMRARLLQVEEWLCAGQTRAQVKGRMRKEWGVATRTSQRYLRAVYRKWASEGKAEERADFRQKRRAAMRERLEFLFRKAVEEGEYKVAATVAQTLIRLDGLENTEPVKVEVQHSATPGASGDWKANPYAFLEQMHGQAKQAKPEGSN